MRGPKPEALSLNEQERSELTTLVRRHNTPQQVALRGRIILAADAGKNNSQIAREEGVSVDTVRTWRKRWLAQQGVALADRSISERLSDEARPGRPSQITAEQTCQLMALACEQPRDRPISQWTGREIADEVKRRGIIAQISPRRPPIKKGDLKPHLIRYWLTPPADEKRDETVKMICALYQQAPQWAKQGEQTVSTDELTGVQVLERKYPGLPLAAGKVERRGIRVCAPWHPLLHPESRCRHRPPAGPNRRAEPHRGRFPGSHPSGRGHPANGGALAYRV